MRQRWFVQKVSARKKRRNIGLSLKRGFALMIFKARELVKYLLAKASNKDSFEKQFFRMALRGENRG